MDNSDRSSGAVIGPALDHIVILVPHEKLKNLPAWITEAFIVLDGGAHAGGQTENKLIVFQDGTYIELIAFVDGLAPDTRKTHRWGERPEGRIIDWALTLTDPAASDFSRPTKAEHEFHNIQARVRDSEVGIEYDNLVEGGRTTPNGTVLKWAVASPIFNDETTFIGGELPFWCLDRTPRLRRVPHKDPKNVEHPCGAVGLSGVSVLVEDAAAQAKYRRVFDAVTSTPARHSSLTYTWHLQVPESQGGAPYFELGTFEEWKLSGARGSDRFHAAVDRVYVRIALFTADKAGMVEGCFSDDWLIEIDLLPAKE